MTIQASILLLTPHTDTSTIDECVNEAFREISRIRKTATVEDDDGDLDQIAQKIAIHLLDRKRKAQQAMTDPTIQLPEYMPKELIDQVKEKINFDVDEPSGLDAWGNNPPDFTDSKSWTV